MTALLPSFETPSGLTARNLTVSRGDMTLFDELSLTLNAGDVLWIQGSNGIGKTTLLKALCGLSRPNNGDVKWQQSGTSTQAENVIAYQPHNAYAKGAMTAEEDLTFWAKMSGSLGCVSAALEYVGLSERRGVACQNLSAGQRRRLGLAKLILSQKPIWIMDEPGAAMDIAGISLIDGLIDEHVERGGSAIIASHSQARKLGSTTRILTLQAQT